MGACHNHSGNDAYGESAQAKLRHFYHGDDEEWKYDHSIMPETIALTEPDERQ